MFYSAKSEADRAFFRDVLGFRSVDAGGGWLIFTLPPAEPGIHPVESPSGHVSGGGPSLRGASVYLMCDDLHAEIKRLRAKKVECSAVETQTVGRHDHNAVTLRRAVGAGSADAPDGLRHNAGYCAVSVKTTTGCPSAYGPCAVTCTGPGDEGRVSVTAALPFASVVTTGLESVPPSVVR